MIVSLFDPAHVAENAYWAKVKPVVDWQFMLVIGLFIGAFLAAKLSGSFKPSLVPDLFAARFGRGVGRRWGIGLLGGVLLGFGARMADGCTSGHIERRSPARAQRVGGGAGFALLGFCPGTCVAAGGEGRLDGLYSGLIGLIIGAGLYAEVYPSLLPGFLKIGALGKATLPQLLSLGVWPTVGLVAGVLGVAVWYLDRVDRRVQKQAQPRGCPVTATL